MWFVEVTEENIADAGRIHSESWKESHWSFCSAEFVEKHTPAAQTAFLRREMDAGKHIYMLIDEYPVGIVSVYGSLIENLYVLPSEQRKGYGSRLLYYAIRKCTGIPCLWILDNNEGAYRLYTRNGFTITGNRNPITETLYEVEMSLSKVEMTESKIRKAIPGDEQVLAYIQTESWKAAFADILSPEELERCTNLQRAERMYYDVLRREGCNMAIEYVEDKPHCIAAWGRNRCDLGSSVGELICIHSLRENWAKGYGSAMMEYVLTQLKQADYEAVILWVFEENFRARKFYEKHGFLPTDSVKISNGIGERMYMHSFNRG